MQQRLLHRITVPEQDIGHLQGDGCTESTPETCNRALRSVVEGVHVRLLNWTLWL